MREPDYRGQENKKGFEAREDKGDKVASFFLRQIIDFALCTACILAALFPTHPLHYTIAF